VLLCFRDKSELGSDGAFGAKTIGMGANQNQDTGGKNQDIGVNQQPPDTTI
jgi:hypothetical protein